MVHHSLLIWQLRERTPSGPPALISEGGALQPPPSPQHTAKDLLLLQSGWNLYMTCISGEWEGGTAPLPAAPLGREIDLAVSFLRRCPSRPCRNLVGKEGSPAPVRDVACHQVLREAALRYLEVGRVSPPYGTLASFF